MYNLPYSSFSWKSTHSLTHNYINITQCYTLSVADNTFTHRFCGSAIQEPMDWRMELRVSWFHSQDVAVAEGLMEVGELASTVSHSQRWLAGAACRDMASAARLASFSLGLLPWELLWLQMSWLLSALRIVGLAWSQTGSAVGYSTCFHVS